MGAHRPPPCPSAPASRSGRGSPSASEFLLPWRALDWESPLVWVVPIRARRSLIRCRGDLDCSPLQCDHGGDAEHQHREVFNGARAPHQESGETAFYLLYYVAHFTLQCLE